MFQIKAHISLMDMKLNAQFFYIQLKQHIGGAKINNLTFRSMVFSLTRVEIFSSSFEFNSIKSLALDSISFTYTFFRSRAC